MLKLFGAIMVTLIALVFIAAILIAPGTNGSGKLALIGIALILWTVFFAMIADE